MALRSVKRPSEDVDQHRLNYVKTRNCYSSSAAGRDISNLPPESRKKLRQEEEEKQKQQQNKKRRSRFDVKPKEVLLLEQKELKKKADEVRLIAITSDSVGPYIDKEPADCTDEELIASYCEGLLYGTIDKETAMKEAPALRQYLIQVEVSEGFDIDVWPNLHCIPMSAPYPAERSPKWDDHYLMLARFALEDYNENNGTFFQVDQLVKVYGAPRGYYYMTFNVKNPSNTFQAKVSQSHISVCRPKPDVK